jgi:YVTN family beta-propeller protein
VSAILAIAPIALLAAAIVVVAVACGADAPGVGDQTSASPTTSTAPATGGTSPAIDTVAGMPPVLDPRNLYSETSADKVNPAWAGQPLRAYVPNGLSNDVTIIDVATKQVIGTFPAGVEPQHVVPAYDGSTLWVLNNQSYSLIPIDPVTAQPGPAMDVDDPYNLYFTPDGSEAIVVAEALKRLDFRDPKTMELHSQLDVPECGGINHIDFSIDGRYLVATCEFAGRVAKIDLVRRKLVGLVDLGPGAMPQDVRASPDGKTFYVAEMMSDGVVTIDGDSFIQTGFIPTGVGTHGLYPSRDGTELYVVNRGSHSIPGGAHGPGSVSVLDFATNQVVADWAVPDGGSPDMGNLTPDGRELWLSGRYDHEVYVFDTTTGALAARIPVGDGPHGLTVWPQPGRYSLGHTGNMR